MKLLQKSQRVRLRWCFGLFELKLTGVSATLVLLGATIVAATACYFLVELTNTSAKGTGCVAVFCCGDFNSRSFFDPRYLHVSWIGDAR